ncbi:MAG: hypothetical protein HY364_03945 [Candidatus Aenigmarchaeota archaeon]|nr:hypothetical protein [Candidatus Aenigmarchaeota archaeon]
MQKLHQHFISSNAILNEEVALAELKKEDVILEIGAGPAYLTRKLAAKAKVLAVEKDEKFIPTLQAIANVDVFHEDALVFLKKEHEFSKVVSNIPYYISQPLLLALLKKKWEICVLLVQKEFAEKAISQDKLGLLVEDCCDAEIAGIVPAEAFAPKGIDSAFLVLKQKKIMDEKFWAFLRHAYTMKNKNAGILPGTPGNLKTKKIHQLSLDEIKKIYAADKV